MQSERRSSSLLPISRLHFSSLELVGRDNEKELLEAILKRVAPPTKGGGSRELVLISGEAGTGKSALSIALAKSVETLVDLYVKGNFNIYLVNKPCTIASACREICGRILLTRDNESFVVIRKELITKLGSENLCLLINIIPELAEIVGDDVIMEDMKQPAGGRNQGSLELCFPCFYANDNKSFCTVAYSS